MAKAGNGNWFARHKVITAVAATVLFFGVIGAVSDGEPDTGDEAASADQDWQPDAENDDQSDEAEPAVAEEPTPEETEEPSDRDKTPKSPEPDVEREYLVVHIVDGDTLELGNGETVRLVGIDTPEVGECGFEESASRLRELVGGQAVTLGESDEDRDQYDRLLRYVDIGAMDAGYRLIRDGLATARYDSRDGYGRHPREDAYIAADRRSADITCAPPPEPKNFADTGGGGNCDPSYSPCVPLYPPDLDCADTGPVTVHGSDPHGLDADGDGQACGGD
ncbi:endonuclease YncB(thermonuclease family) [Nocardioides thalensis]|uniref:Endonuclease YncB(Thermonuclease family) n=1 Tax=Nocardioides thalensis TaxID=1914755 RepID=A0A853BVQ4_9ACTN|nr:thermonuclease family protein [Nocardioides thalensis]NYI99959.1 endonuclease YncB(thermonuclease family) [Nocardioides thalensis]